jgi:hypothetical protein
MKQAPRRWPAPLLGVIAAALVACGSAPATPPASTRAGSSTSCSRAKAVSEHADGKTVRLCVRQKLEVELHSTYWRDLASSDRGVLRKSGRTVVRPAAPTACVPGSGCGTTTAHFVARTRGRARITAHRYLCGEAVRCRPGRRSFALIVVVRRASR